MRWAIRGVSALVLAAMVVTGTVALTGGLSERRNAGVLAAPDSIFVSAVGTVKAHAGNTEWSQMPVRFDTEDGEQVETMVWTRQGNRDFDAGETVDLEYFAQDPRAARLADGQGGPAKSMGTIVAGAGILVAALLLAGAWTWDAFTGSSRRKRSA